MKEGPRPAPPAPEPADAAIVPRVADAAPAPDASPTIGWLRGSTHVHALPSGDSATPIAEVVRWYEDHGYDFIVLTDHNKVTPPPTGTRLIVVAGVELTHNSNDCTDPPPPVAEPKCRLHINAIGVTARPDGKIPWDEHATKRRAGTYALAIDEAKALGGIAQVNHPQWHWGMTAPLLIELARRGALLYEVWNVQFAEWNRGDADHLSTEALWDAALADGETLWGVASDDAHDYDGVPGKGKYPAGGAWVMVHASRDPISIVSALAAGDFYGSTGVSLARAGVEDGALVVEVADDDPGPHTITFIGAGRVLREDHARTARFALADAPGYVRAVVTRDADGAKAWVQPARPLAR